MKRDELLFATGLLVGTVLTLLLGYITFPWWTLLVTVPLGIWWLARLILGWRTEARRKSIGRRSDGG